MRKLYTGEKGERRPKEAKMRGQRKMYAGKQSGGEGETRKEGRI